MEPSCGGGAQQHPSNHQRSVVMSRPICFICRHSACFQAHPTRPPTPPNHLTSDPAMASQMAFHEMSAAEVRRGRRGARVAEAGRGRRGARTKAKERRRAPRPARALPPGAPPRAIPHQRPCERAVWCAAARGEGFSVPRGWVRRFGFAPATQRRAARAARRFAPLTHPSHASIWYGYALRRRIGCGGGGRTRRGGRPPGGRGHGSQPTLPRRTNHDIHLLLDVEAEPRTCCRAEGALHRTKTSAHDVAIAVRPREKKKPERAASTGRLRTSWHGWLVGWLTGKFASVGLNSALRPHLHISGSCV